MTLPPEPDTTAIQTDDPVELRRLLAAALNDREQVIQERNRVLETQNQHITALSLQVQQLEELLRLMRLRQFGVRSEATPPEQISLFNEAELMEKVDELLPEDNEAVSEDPKTPPRKAGRRPLPASLPRVRIEHDLA
jgi:transposase